MSKGKLIVLEGIDGSGKSTNYKLLCDRLTENGVDYHSIVFPRYDQESSALIRMYLNGEFGSKPDDVNAYTASTFFSVDRFASYKSDWGALYEKGAVIMADRYTTSNAVHQGAKMDKNELAEYFDWLYDLEFDKMKLPKPDLVLYLDVDIDMSLSRMRKREAQTNTNADIHEKDINYLKRCLETAQIACEHFGWIKIPCRDMDGRERTIQEVHEDIFRHVREII